MTINFDIPLSVEKAIARTGRAVATELKEAALVELYRQGKISHGEFADGLGVARSEADSVLKRHNVIEDLLTDSELANQVAKLRKLVG